MQFEERAIAGSGGLEEEEVRLDSGEMWRNPPKALDILVFFDG